jgi:hypothetical protein
MVLQDTAIVTQDRIAECRKMGSWDKTHDITTYIPSSPEKLQEFKLFGGDTRLHRDNAIHWNTGYTKIQSMIRNRDAEEASCLHHLDQLEEDQLSVNDWKQLEHAVRILQPLHSATLLMESEFSELHNVFVELDFVCATFTNVLGKSQANTHLHICKGSTEEILVQDKYHELYKQLALCVAAAV